MGKLIAVSPNGRTALSGFLDKKVRVWNIESGESHQSCVGDSSIYSCCISLYGIVASDKWDCVSFFSRDNFPDATPIVSAWKSNGTISVRCLHNGLFFEPGKRYLDQEVDCPKCGGWMRLNPLVVEDPWGESSGDYMTLISHPMPGAMTTSRKGKQVIRLYPWTISNQSDLLIPV